MDNASAGQSADERQELVDALEDLISALNDSVAISARALSRARILRSHATGARPLRALLREQEPPRLVELITENLRLLEAHGSRVRRAGSRALRAEGMTMDEIAEAFGVTRQRISALLHERC